MHVMRQYQRHLFVPYLNHLLFSLAHFIWGAHTFFGKRNQIQSFGIHSGGKLIHLHFWAN